MATRKGPLTEEEKELRALDGLYRQHTAEAELGGGLDRTKVGAIANGLAVKMLQRILIDEWEVPNAEQAAKIAKLAFDIGRVADGLPTTISAPAKKEDLKKLLQEAKERAEKGEA